LQSVSNSVGKSAHKTCHSGQYFNFCSN